MAPLETQTGYTSCLDRILHHDNSGRIRSSTRATPGSVINTTSMTTKTLFQNPANDNTPLSPVQLERLIELQSTLLSAAVSNENFNNLLEQLCLFAENLTEHAVASVMLLVDNREGLYVAAAPSISLEAIKELNGLQPGEGSCGNAVFHNEDMYVCDTMSDSRWRSLHAFATKHKIHACWSSPIRDSHNKAIGSFALSSFSTRKPDNFQRRLLNSCASIASIILQRKATSELHQQHQYELLRSKQRYISILENSADSICLVDRHGNFIDANHVAYERLGYTREEYLSMNVADIETEPGPGSFEEFFDNLELNKRICLEGKLKRKDGTLIPVDIRLRKFESEQEQMLVVSTTDISERKLAEEERLRASKLESIGMLAGGIAHDFNNLLGIILGHIDLAAHRLDANNPVRTSLQKARIALTRATDLTQQLLTFSKGGEPVRKVYDIRAIIQEAIDFSTHGANITTQLNCCCDNTLALVDKGQISQVAQNLVINARQAMPDGGTLNISGANIMVTNEQPVADLAPGRYIKIRFTDTGSGIPEAIKTSIFDPYFTTKQGGSGLGLAITYSILKKHGGYITAENNPEGGSCFTIYLPEATHPSVEYTETSLDNHDQQMRARILIMDDDTMIREVARAMLVDAGCEVTEAEEGEMAVQLYREAAENGNKFDLVIMDLTVINGMGGKQAMQLIRQFDPSAKALVSSGYSNDPVMANYSENGFCGAVSKPYTQQELETAVREALAGC